MLLSVFYMSLTTTRSSFFMALLVGNFSHDQREYTNNMIHLRFFENRKRVPVHPSSGVVGRNTNNMFSLGRRCYCISIYTNKMFLLYGIATTST